MIAFTYDEDGRISDVIGTFNALRELSGIRRKLIVSEFQLMPPWFKDGGGMFKGMHFERSGNLLCVRWYCAYNLSLRNLEEMIAERGISVDHVTVHRWVVRYSPELLERFNR